MEYESLGELEECINEDDMPLCPLCDNLLIIDEGPVMVIGAHSCLALAHTMCVDVLKADEEDF